MAEAKTETTLLLTGEVMARVERLRIKCCCDTTTKLIRIALDAIEGKPIICLPRRRN